MVIDKKSNIKLWMIILFLIILIISIVTLNNNISKYPEMSEANNIQINNYIVKKGFITIDKEKYIADYGIFKVKEDRNNTSDDSILLPFVKIYSKSDDKKNPVFILNSLSENFLLHYKKSSFLLKQHDIIYMGYRGFGGSKRIKFLNTTFSLYFLESELSNKNLEKIGKAFENDNDKTINGTCIIQNYSLNNIIEDIEQLKKMLGYGKIYLFSIGNGTFIAESYIKKYPDSISKNAMIGSDFYNDFINEKDVDKYFEFCISKLKVNDKSFSVKNANALFSNVLQQLPKKWLFIPINKLKVEVATIFLLKNTNNIRKIIQAYISALNGDYSGIAMISIIYNFLPLHHEISDYYINQVYIENLYTKQNTHQNDQKINIFVTSIPILLNKAKVFNQNKSVEKNQVIVQQQFPQIETLHIAGNLDISMYSNVNEAISQKQNNYTMHTIENTTTIDIVSGKSKNWEMIVLSFFASGKNISLIPDEQIQVRLLIKYTDMMKASLLVIIVIIYPIFRHYIKNISKYFRKRKLIKEYASINKS